MLTIYFLSSVLRRQLRNRLFYVWAFAGFVFVASASQLANCQELTAESGSPRAVEPTEPTESTELVEAASEPVQDSFEASIIKIKPHNELIVQAFKETSDGWSSDEVILQIELNEKFLAAVHEKLKILDVAEVADAAINWRLMTLRKAGKLKIKSTRRAKRSQQDVQPLAEIAMRSIQDKSKLSSDRIMADPVLRGEFDAVVKGLQSGVDLYAVRKAAFQLRKIRRLQPELISRLADWGRVVATYSIADLRSGAVGVDPHPGVYIFRDKTGYLYIGQTENLKKRMAEHLEESHNPLLAKYLKAEVEATVELHSFDPKSRAKEVRVRRAYESELIRSRKPKFNVLP